MRMFKKKTKKDEEKMETMDTTEDAEMKDANPKLEDSTVAPAASPAASPTVSPTTPPVAAASHSLMDEDDGEEEEEPDDTKEEDEVNENFGTVQLRLAKFSKLKKQPYASEPFSAGDAQWLLKVYPYGSPNARPGMVSMFLTIAEPKKMPFGWFRRAEFTLMLVNQLDPSKTYAKPLEHLFREGTSDWGLSGFFSLQELQDTPGFLVDDTVIFQVEVEVYRTPQASSWTWTSWDSKKETGYVGIKNQGATCYLNSLLQALYHIGTFRRAVYLMPTRNDTPEESIPLALQRIFYRLQFDNDASGTKELTAAFGWNRRQSYIQQDVQELNRVFCDNLEAKMKGTISEGMIERLFRGQLLKYIRCKHVDYESKRTEPFYDVSLNVKGLDDVYASLDDYVAVETLSGDNKYDAGVHGLQDAEMGCAFQSLPPVLELHLKRFIYDPEYDRNCKINDRYAFPQTLNLSKYMHKDADQSIKPLYRLFGVLVHSGDVHGGHYYAYIRPTTKMQWYKFDDDRVTKAKKKDVFEGTFGGEDRRTVRGAAGKTMSFPWKRTANAYMLLYIRDADRENLIAPVPSEEIPTHLRERFEREEAEKAARKKEKEEAHLYLRLKVARMADYTAHHNFDLCDYNHVPAFKVKKASTIKEFKNEIASTFNIPPHRQRFWQCPNRRNGTVRPDEPFSEREQDYSLDKFLKRPATELKVWLEESKAPEDCMDDATLFHTPGPDEAIMFFKYYDPEAQLITLLNYTFVNTKEPIGSIIPSLIEWAGLPAGTSLNLYEEIKPTMIDALKLTDTFQAAELSNGDIICFQKTPVEGVTYKLPTAQDYYTYMLNRVTVKFRELENPGEDKHVMELQKNMGFDDVVAELGPRINVDPAVIRLTAHSKMYEKPRAFPIARSDKPKLMDMLCGWVNAPPSDILYYEVLDMPLAELESNKLLKIDWYNEKTEQQSSHKVLVPKNSRMSNVIAKIKELVPEAAEADIRLLDMHNHKISRLISPDEPTSGYNEYTALRAEVIPEEEKDKNAIRVQAVHFYIDSPLTYYFGTPFFFALNKNEKFSEVKKRIQQKLDVPDEEFAKWKFAILHPYFGKVKYVEDVMKEEDGLLASYMSSSEILGLEHAMPKRLRTARRAEMGVVIKK